MPRTIPSPPHLLARAAEGNPEALSALVCARKERVYRLAAALLTGMLEPDLSSEAPVTMEDLADVCARTGGLKRWMSERGASEEAAGAARDASGEYPVEPGRAGHAVSPEALLGSWHLVRELYRAISSLPHTYRQVLVLIDIEGLQSGEVVWLLDLSEAEVRTRLMQARAHLREQLLSGQSDRKSA